MLKRLSPRVYYWSEIHGAARGEPYIWNSHLIDARHHGALVLVDPLPLTAEDASELEAIGTPTHILITCNYHFRAADDLRAKWGCRVLLHEMGLEDAEIPIDATLGDGDLLWDLIQIIHVPYLTHYPEEIALLVRDGSDTLIVGDLLCGGRQDRGIPDGQLWINGPQYVMDLQEARGALARLGNYRFDILGFGHGTPVIQSARDVLNQFVRSAAAWEKLAAEKADRADAASREFLADAERKRARQTGAQQDR